MSSIQVKNPEPSFPDEGEVSKFFPPGSWEAMEGYEKNSYLNIYHNYLLMKHFGLEPIKPHFMTRDYSKRSSGTAVVCPAPAKVPRLLSPSSASQTKHSKGIDAAFSLYPDGKPKTLKLSSVVGEVLKAHNQYPAYSQHSLMGKVCVLGVSRQEVEVTRPLRFGALLAKIFEFGRHCEALYQHSLQTPIHKQKQSQNGNVEEKMTKLKSVEKENRKPPSKAVEVGQKQLENRSVAAVVDEELNKKLSLENKNKQKNLENEKGTKLDEAKVPMKKPVLPKKPQRSVQTQTAREMQIIDTAALVFVSSAASVKLSTPSPPQPKLDSKTKKKILQWQKMNTRSILTQTAKEGESIEEAKLVSIIVMKKPTVKAPKEKSCDNSVSEVKDDSSEDKNKEQASGPLASGSKIEEESKEQPQDTQKASTSKSKPAQTMTLSQDLAVKSKPNYSTYKNETHKLENLSDDVEVEDNYATSFGFTDEENSDNDVNKIELAAASPTIGSESIAVHDFGFSSPECTAKTVIVPQELVDKTKHSVSSSNKSEIQQVYNRSADVVEDNYATSFGFTDEENSDNDINKNDFAAASPMMGSESIASDDFGFSSPECSGVSKTKKPLTTRKRNKTVKQDPHLADDNFYIDRSQSKQVNLPEECVNTQPKKEKALKDAEAETSHKPERRYPRRNVPELNYTESELLQDDEYLFCDACGREYEGDCPEHGPHKHFIDSFAPITGKDDRALLTTPAMLEVNTSKIPGGGSGVWTVIGLPPHTRLGPYQGDKSQQPDSQGYSWTIMKDRKVSHYMTAPSKATSNWMRFVNCARHESEQNLMAFQYKGELYYRTVKQIPPKMELFVWYGKEYAEKLGISLESFRQKDTSHIKNVTFPCESCNINFTSPLYLKSHKKVCRRGKRGSAVKVEVDQIPTDLNSLVKWCDGRKTYCCTLCVFKTTNSGHIKEHLVTHTNSKPHVCDVCMKGFTRDGSLARHKRIHSGGEKLYRCSECSYSSNESGHLKTHMTTHTGEKVFACTQCDYTTAQSSNLKVHTHIHTGEKPYSCTVCSFVTVSASSLTKHAVIHTGEKPYSCTLCDKYKTAYSGDLTRHMKTVHCTDRPHTCPLCSAKYAVKSRLNLHMKHKHPSQ